jgi:hypothetical protein
MNCSELATATTPPKQKRKPVTMGSTPRAGVPRNSVATIRAPWLSSPMWRLRSSSILSSANELRRMSSGSAEHSSDAPNTVIQFTKSRAFSSRPMSPSQDAW